MRANGVGISEQFTNKYGMWATNNLLRAEGMNFPLLAKWITKVGDALDNTVEIREGKSQRKLCKFLNNLSMKTGITFQGQAGQILH